MLAKMKMRVRSSAGGPTLKIDLPGLSTLQSLREALAARLSLPPSSICLSLNKKDEIEGPPDALLASFGICSGDLLFYLNSAPSPTSPDGTSMPANHGTFQGSGASQAAQDAGNNERAAIRRELCAAAATKRASSSSGREEQYDSPLNVSSCLGVDNSTAECKETEDMDASMDMEDPHAFRYGDFCSHFFPVLFRRVLMQENGNLKSPDTLVFLGIHAVMLETGFVQFDPENGVCMTESCLSDGWNAKLSLSISYTLPEMISSGSGYVVLRLQSLGNSVIAYGTLTGQKGCQIYRLCLKTSNFILTEKFNQSCHEGNLPPELVESVFLDVPGFWKEVKDCLSIRLLTDLCERAGLPVPASLLILPTELKMRILEALPAIDLLRIGCTCSELRHLAGNDELWRQRFIEEIGFTEGHRPPCGRGWKDAFRQRWTERKKRQRIRGLRYPVFPGHVPRYGFPSGLGSPHFGIGITGGDYDRFPVIGGPGMFGGPRRSIPGGHLRGMHVMGDLTGQPGSMRCEIDALPGNDLTGLPGLRRPEVDAFPGSGPPNLVTRLGTDGFLGDFLQ